MVKDQEVICKANAQVIFISKWFSILFYVIFSINNNNNNKIKFGRCSRGLLPFICYDFFSAPHTWELPYVCAGIHDQLSASSALRFDYKNAPAIHSKLITSNNGNHFS